jgi:hypothetical protein
MVTPESWTMRIWVFAAGVNPKIECNVNRHVVLPLV